MRCCMLTAPSAHSGCSCPIGYAPQAQRLFPIFRSLTRQMLFLLLNQSSLSDAKFAGEVQTVRLDLSLLDTSGYATIGPSSGVVDPNSQRHR
jgi:hypothetical protein